MSNTHQLFLLKCPDYKSYLDLYVKTTDFYYLQNKDFCRVVVGLGYRSANPILTPSQFHRVKAQILESLTLAKNVCVKFSENLTSTDAVLRELAERESPNQHKIISTIIFMRHRNSAGMEITGYIDYQQSLFRANMGEHGATDWAKVFGEKVKLCPKKTDLSYYDWSRRSVFYNNSDNYSVIHDRDHGLVFMYKGDHKKIFVDMSSRLGANCNKIMVSSEKYGQVVLIDHLIRKKV